MDEALMSDTSKAFITSFMSIDPEPGELKIRAILPTYYFCVYLFTVWKL